MRFPRSFPLCRGSRGVTLLEIVIAAAVFIAGSVGAFGLLLTTEIFNQSADFKTYAVRACERVMEEVLAAPSPEVLVAWHGRVFPVPEIHPSDPIGVVSAVRTSLDPDLYEIVIRVDSTAHDAGGRRIACSLAGMRNFKVN